MKDLSFIKEYFYNRIFLLINHKKRIFNNKIIPIFTMKK
jgi:hypothetical protein